MQQNCFKKSSSKVTGDLIENKIADKITSLDKTKRRTRNLHITRKEAANY